MGKLHKQNSKKDITDKIGDNRNFNRQPNGTFGAGNVANPDGRPVFSLTSLLREEIQKAPEGQKQTYAEAFLKKMLHKAIIEGDHASQRLIMNYLEGLPVQKIIGDKDNPLFIQVSEVVAKKRDITPKSE